MTSSTASVLVSFSLVGLGASFTACGRIAYIGDFPDAGADGSATTAAPLPDGGRSFDAAGSVSTRDPDASGPVDGDASVTDADTTDANPTLPDGGVATSCLDVHRVNPAAPSGVYWLLVDGQVIGVYCNMTLASGGWSAFYAGPLGAPNVFAHFDREGQISDDCDAPASRCLRHLPSAVTVASDLAAECGANAVRFDASAELLAYLRDGTPGSWVPLGHATGLTPSAHAEWATYFWSGGQQSNGTSDGNLGWIISVDAFPSDTTHQQTFASAYDSRGQGWDYCNGLDYNGAAAGSSTPMVRLYYR